MGVQIDEAGRDEQAGGVDLAVTRAVAGADGDDDAARDRDVAAVGLATESIDDGAVADNEVIAHASQITSVRR